MAHPNVCCVRQVSDVSVDWERRWLGAIPRVIFADKGSYIESDTRKYDKLAFRYSVHVLLVCSARPVERLAGERHMVDRNVSEKFELTKHKLKTVCWIVFR